MQRKSAIRPLWQNGTRKLEVFGSFLGSFYTGGIRIPLRTTGAKFVGCWLGFLLLLWNGQSVAF
ncbi:hypothetical protein OAN307_c18930 [Octadecabacter antarcticus 307]|uniref:Uncharacterized protein n=1 Tax=Octadecabacter antarcticus 307 TaxID=391626 RepID=M9RCL4_9RHOB|nr:hypothetical protein OAN307_c18930 [Octadecabacter antarcticus 307]